MNLPIFTEIMLQIVIYNYRDYGDDWDSLTSIKEHYPSLFCLFFLRDLILDLNFLKYNLYPNMLF